MTNWLATNKILVFPSARRSYTQVSARLSSESSFVNIVNKLIDTDGFIITPDATEELGSYVPTAPFEFNIHGYYFKVDQAADITDLASSSDTAIYGTISMDNTGDYYELQGQDQSNTYRGLKFTNTQPVAQSNEELYSLLLFKRENSSSSWYIPEESRLKFTHGFLMKIDGGEIT